jgi:hypothetical protein
MSWSVNVCVRRVNVGQVVHLLRTRYRVEMTREPREEDEAFFAYVFGIEVYVNEGLDLEDDAGIEFTKYPIIVEFRLRGGTLPPEHGRRLVFTLAFSLADGLRAVGGECIVVEGVQRLVSEDEVFGGMKDH